MKYVFKESELKAALKQIIAEEISRIDEGFGKKLLHGLGKVALGAAKTAILPDHMLGKAVDKIAFKPFKGELPIGHGSSSSNGLGNSSQRKSLGNEEVLDNIISIKKAYGEPATESGKKNVLAKPERMTIKNLFGTAFDADFGEHYLENNQSANNSIWMKKLNKLAKEAASENNPNDFVKSIFPELKAWLKKRDRAYQQYVRII